MSGIAQEPYLVVDAVSGRGNVDTPPYQAFLDWCRSEGIDPEKGNRCEVFEGHDGKPPYAIVHYFETNADGVKIYDEVTEVPVTYTDIVTLSSLPPSREA